MYEALEAAKDRCDNLAEARQQSVQAEKWTNGKLSDGPPLHSYLYANLDVTCPILADLAEFGLSLQRMRKHVENALARGY